MISVDTNILLYAQNIDCPVHRSAYDFVQECGNRNDVVLCELVLVELYVLLRNPAIFVKPLSAQQAVTICRIYRRNPKWRIVENAPVMESVWHEAGSKSFARRKIFDIRLALTLQHHGVTELATANTKDFANLGFTNVWNPLTTYDS